MNRPKQIVILDDSQLFRKETEKVLCEAGYQIAESTSDPEKALFTISHGKVDLLITDILLSETEGIDFIKRIKNEYETTVLICSQIRAESIVSTALNHADYYLYKPVTPSRLADTVALLCGKNIPEEPLDEEQTLNKLEKEITAIISDLAIPAKVKGYHYIRYAIICALQAPESAFAVTKTIYPLITRKFGTTQSKAERSIRHAIEIAWTNAPIEKIEAIFGSMSRRRPSNAVFIATIADKLRMSNTAYKELYTMCGSV
jgi:two-component system response regulator (stage 0 sporulation protein A)